MADKNKDKGKHSSGETRAQKEKRQAQEVANAPVFWQDAAEDSGVVTHPNDDKRNVKKAKRGKHRNK